MQRKSPGLVTNISNYSPEALMTLPPSSAGEEKNSGAGYYACRKCHLIKNIIQFIEGVSNVF